MHHLIKCSQSLLWYLELPRSVYISSWLLPLFSLYCSENLDRPCCFVLAYPLTHYIQRKYMYVVFACEVLKSRQQFLGDLLPRAMNVPGRTWLLGYVSPLSDLRPIRRFNTNTSQHVSEYPRCPMELMRTEGYQCP